jgi:hypothetical protein
VFFPALLKQFENEVVRRFTSLLKNRDSIRKRQPSKMQLNTEFHQKSRCRFAFKLLSAGGHCGGLRASMVAETM